MRVPARRNYFRSRMHCGRDVLPVSLSAPDPILSLLKTSPASKPGVKVRNLSPHFRKMLVSAVRRGSIIKEKIISCKLVDAEAYAMEWQMIWDYHRRHAGQLWNTIDERGRNPEDLPEKWSNPVFPLYRLPRPFDKLPTSSNAPIEGKSAMQRVEHGARERTIIRIAPRLQKANHFALRRSP